MYLLVKILFIFACIIFHIPAFAGPSVSTVEGVFSQSNTLVIYGTDFGSKSPAIPYLWAPFESSVSPSQTLSTVTRYTVEAMEYDSDDGPNMSGCLKASDSSGTWTVSIDASGFSWNDYSQQMYLFRKAKSNFEITSSLNWKIWRMWPSAVDGNYPNMYVQTGNGSVAIEGMTDAGGYVNTTIARGTALAWNTEEILVQANTASGTTDGIFTMFTNGVTAGYIPYTTYRDWWVQLRADAGTSNIVRNYPVHGVKANTTFPTDYRYWVDDVYLDITWARVMVGNASTLSASTHREIQIPTAWAAGAITATFNQGTFGAGEAVYLFVVDSTGTASAGAGPYYIGEDTSYRNLTKSATTSNSTDKSLTLSPGSISATLGN